MANTMNNIVNWPDEKVFGAAGEQNGSQMSYWRDIEIKRRLFVLQKHSLEAQIAATEEQRKATAAQEAAIVEMRAQSKIMFWSVVGIFITAIVTLGVAFIK